MKSYLLSLLFSSLMPSRSLDCCYFPCRTPSCSNSNLKFVFPEYTGSLMFIGAQSHEAKLITGAFVNVKVDIF
uniref:Secreted protein n=1 Tax=Haemonchus contortus TaxID=6289 RepID=A0A7I4YNE0_HAECO